MLRLFDSASGEVRELELREPGRVSIYVCGPTVSGLPHLGHGRFSLVWDVVRRWLTWQGLEVTYASNITDIDDKIIDRARQEGRDHTDVAVQFEAEWWSAMAGLGIARPDRVPYATQYVGEMVDLISTLLERDIAYITSDGVYFDVSRVEDYGLLAGQPLESLRSGARIEANEEKRSPLDFAVWKFAKIGEPMWEAPFGQGRPGWHTECVVMSLGLLGEGFELHTGGQDLKFPHHENERAQAVALGARFARHWGHNGWVVVGGEKMGKSLNNYTSLTDLLSTTDQRAYRLLVLRSHYRSPIEVSKETIADAERALARLDAFARRFELAELAGAQHMARADERSFTDESLDLRAHVAALLDDDLDTPRAVSVLFEAVTRAHARADHGDDAAARELAEAVNSLFAAMGLSLRAATDDVDDDSAALVSARDEARSRKEWAEADRLRDELVTRGWTVEDSAAGTVIRR